MTKIFSIIPSRAYIHIHSLWKFKSSLSGQNSLLEEIREQFKITFLSFSLSYSVYLFYQLYIEAGLNSVSIIKKSIGPSEILAAMFEEDSKKIFELEKINEFMKLHL